MKNLKKVLAFVTMITMLLSVAVSAGTLYPDVDDNASYVEAVETLNALGIMIGDDKGNFNPEASITRAETAAIVTRMKALGEAASAAGGTNFSDVPADHWAAGYINLAEQSKIINGYGDGTFGPSDAVTYEQVIKMIVAALGYTPEADTKGGYPSGYMIIASREEITKGVSVTAGAEAPRSAVARLVFNALDVPVMEQVSFKTGEEEFAAQDGVRYPLKTLLKNALKVDKYEGVINDTYLTAGNDVEDDFIKILVDSVNGSKDDEVYEEIGTTVSFAEGKTNAAPLFGNWVVAYVVEDDETGEDTLIGITKKSGKNTEITIDYTQLVAFTAPTSTVNGELSYYETETSTIDTDLEIVAGVSYYFNGKKDASGAEFIDFMDDVEADEIAIGTVTLVDNNNDDVYDIIMLMSATNNYVVNAVDAAAKRLEAKDGSNIPLDVDDANTIVKFYKADGTVADFADIKEGDVLTTYENGNLVTVYISDAKVEGVVKEQIPAANEDHAYGIADGNYRVAYQAGDFVIGVNVGDDGIFYLNHIGRIVAKDAAAASGNYAYLLEAVKTSDINGVTVEMKYMTSEGVWETAMLAAKVTPIINGNAGDAVAVAEIDAQFAPLFVKSADEAEGFITEGTAQQRLFQFSKNSAGKINKLFIISNEEGAPAMEDSSAAFSMDLSATDKIYKASQKKLGNLYFNDETPVFSINTALADEDDVTLTKVSAFFSDDTTYDCLVEGYDIENGVPSMVVAYDATADILESTKGLLVTKISTITNANGASIKKLYGYQNGVEVTAEEAEDFWTVSGADDEVEAGDFVIFSLDANGAIDKIDVLMDVDTAATIINDSKIKRIPATAEQYIGEYGTFTRNIFGFAQKRKTGGQLVIAESWYEGAAALDDDGSDMSLLMTGKDVSFYEVNLLRTPNSYAVSSYGEIETESRVSTASKDRVSNWVYVREYDGAVMDVVIYTAENPTEAEWEAATSTDDSGSGDDTTTGGDDTTTDGE